MIKCTGVCSKCGRCKGSAMMSGANDRKTKMLAYPDGFSADKGKGLAAAFDIGTTTVVGMLWDLEAGEQIATAARTNPQNEFGLDVISRITYCGREGENLDVLRGSITDCINEITEEICSKAGRSIEEIHKVSVAGNTTMSHLFAGYPPMNLALAPFTPAYTGAVKLKAEDALLKLGKDADVTVIPNIAGHVGGDITAGIIASRVLDMEGLSMFIDIGTNGEIVITDGKDSYACSTAAGPAFEGACIKCGMRAAEGAIEKISIEGGDVKLRTIGEKEAQGICGSGLIDALAEMLDAKLIDKKGRLASAADVEKKKFDPALCERLIETEKGREFILTEKEDGERIVISQNDIREVQLAKGAIKAGIQIMLGRYGKTVNDLDRVIVAGAFGNYIDKESAVRIGLLPGINQDKIISAGNTAGAGVSMTAVNKKEMEFAERIPELVKHIELAQEEDFQTKYLMAMAF
ncbi:MAG: ASKHA domain-containing protein [Eubacteriales bacterium]|nr:ASKHA domain-containing protein [Eubacteriales bacterium]